MKKLLVYALLVLGLMSACASCAGPIASSNGIRAQATDDRAIENALSATVVVYDYTLDLICAGQRVSPIEVLTAFHCVAAANFSDEQLEQKGVTDDPNTLELLNEKEFLGLPVPIAAYEDYIRAGYSGTVKGDVTYVVRVDKYHDVAILKTKPSSQTYVELRDEPVAVGLPVFSIGHPVGLEFSFARGYVSNTCRWLRSPTCWVQTDISVWGGSSGGALYDLHGKLISIAARRILGTYGFFTDPAATRKIVRDH